MINRSQIHHALNFSFSCFIFNNFPVFRMDSPLSPSWYLRLNLLRFGCLRKVGILLKTRRLMMKLSHFSNICNISISWSYHIIFQQSQFVLYYKIFCFFIFTYFYATYLIRTHINLFILYRSQIPWVNYLDLSFTLSISIVLFLFLLISMRILT